MDRARIVLIERSRSQRHSFADALSKHFDVVSVPSGRQARKVAETLLPGVFVVNAISMQTPGERICKQIKRSLPNTPLILLSELAPAKGQDIAADSVLAQPFTARKVLNAINRLLRQGDESDLIDCGVFAIDLARRVLIANGQETQLTPKLAQLVEVFLRNVGQTLDRKTLMEQVWQTDYLGDTRTLNVHIRWIRRAIEADPNDPMYLKTVRGVGYRLDLPVAASVLPHMKITNFVNS